MKRLIVAGCLLAAPTASAAVHVAPGDRVAVVQPAATDEQRDSWLLNQVRRRLTVELRSLGVAALDAQYTYADAVTNRSAEARYLVDLVAVNASRGVVPADVTPRLVPPGSVAVSATNEVLVSDISTTIDLELRLYDGETFQLLQTFEVHENVSGAPAFGVDKFWALMPFPRYVSARSAARAAAREAALKIADINQIE